MRAPTHPEFEAVRMAVAQNKHVDKKRVFSVYNVLTVKGKIFAMLVKGRLVVQLPKVRVDAMVNGGAGERFDPGHGRKMKEWVAVEPGVLPWVELAQEACEYVKSGKR